jgi:ketosteroid isomerase-like protein
MRRLCIILGLLLAIDPITAQEKTPTGADAAIRKVLGDQAAAWNKGDLAEFMKGYWNSKDLTFYTGKDKYLGWDKALDRYKQRYQGEGNQMGKLTFSELEVQLLSREFAVVKGRWNVEMKQEKLNGLFTLIMQNTDRGWLIVHDHTSS